MDDTRKNQPAGAPVEGDAAGDARTVKQERLGEASPRLPHEHDESADSQRSQPRQVIQQAHDDVESGQEDTDLRGSQGKRQTGVPAERDND